MSNCTSDYALSSRPIFFFHPGANQLSPVDTGALGFSIDDPNIPGIKPQRTGISSLFRTDRRSVYFD
jgi:hypothetical protein